MTYKEGIYEWAENLIRLQLKWHVALDRAQKEYREACYREDAEAMFRWQSRIRMINEVIEDLSSFAK